MEISAEIVARYTPVDEEELITDFSLQTGYSTPKVDVRGAVVQERRILLVQERTDEKWCMPGGWADIGEKPSAMVEREVLEESGFTVKARRVIGVYDANRSGHPLSFYHAYKIVFDCELLFGEACPSEETMAVGFFPFDDIPSLSAQRTSERHLHDVCEFVANTDRLVYFD
jgi:ADP-ribose pyrophosphatase YjhB (NUDIX family)